MFDKNIKLRCTARAAGGLILYAVVSNFMLLAVGLAANLARGNGFAVDFSFFTKTGMMLAETAAMAGATAAAAAFMSQGDHSYYEAPRGGDPVFFFELFFAALFASSFLNQYAMQLFRSLGFAWEAQVSGISGGAVSVILSVVRYVVLPAVAEELLFRGALLRTLMPAGKRGAVIVTAVMFTLFHSSAAQWPGTLLIALVMTYTAAVTGSVIPSTVMHLMNNAFALIIVSYPSGGATRFISIMIAVFGVSGAVYSIAKMRYQPSIEKGGAGAGSMLASPLLLVAAYCIAITVLSAVKV